MKEEQNLKISGKPMLLVGMLGGTTTLEDSITSSYKTNISTTWSSIHTFWCLFRGVENLYSQQNLHLDIYRSLIQIAKSWKQLGCLQWVNGYINYGTSGQLNITGMKKNEWLSHKDVREDMKET